MTHDQALTLLGAKYYRANKETGEIEIIRVVGVKSNNECKCIQEGKEDVFIPAEDILAHYTKLINDGVIVFAIVETISNEQTGAMTPDVVVIGYTKKRFDAGEEPDVICRQNIIDIFQAIYAASYNKKEDRDREIVGTCVTKASIPRNMNMEMLTQCDKVTFSVVYNTYLQDNIDTFIDILKGKRLKKIDEVLEKCMLEYMNYNKIPDLGQKQINGHCRDLETLLKNNNFGYDWDSIFGITPVKFAIDDNVLVHNSFEDGTEYHSFNSEAINIFSKIFQLKINKTIVVEYDHDIDLSEFEEGTYFLVRDLNKKLFVVRYTSAGQYIESELVMDDVRKAMENIAIVNKYKKGSKSTF